MLSLRPAPFWCRLWLPACLDFQSTAGAGLTALPRLRDLLDVSPGQRIVVFGGAGGWARSRSRSASGSGQNRRAALVRSLGAGRDRVHARALRQHAP
jgi:NADPH:quinone reductase-like Zn-dependent oxidoreductase